VKVEMARGAFHAMCEERHSVWWWENKKKNLYGDMKFTTKAAQSHAKDTGWVGANQPGWHESSSAIHLGASLVEP
jgi:hypothetical protein